MHDDQGDTVLESVMMTVEHFAIQLSWMRKIRTEGWDGTGSLGSWQCKVVSDVLRVQTNANSVWIGFGQRCVGGENLCFVSAPRLTFSIPFKSPTRVYWSPGEVRTSADRDEHRGGISLGRGQDQVGAKESHSDQGQSMYVKMPWSIKGGCCFLGEMLWLEVDGCKSRIEKSKSRTGYKRQRMSFEKDILEWKAEKLKYRDTRQ